MSLAEERAFELDVRGVERAVVPVEAAAPFGGRDQQRQDDGAEERVVLGRAPAGVRAREDPRRRLAAELLEREPRVFAPRERRRARLDERPHERAVLVQRRTPERLVLLERERHVLVDEQPERSEREPAQRAIEVRSAHGHAVRYSAVGPSPLWQPGAPVRHPRRVAERPRPDRRAAARAAVSLAPVDAVPRGRAGETAVHQARGGFERGAQLVVGRLGEREPRRHARLEERLAHPHVPDAGDRALYLQGLSEGLSLGQGPKVRDHRVHVGRLGEDVGPESQPRAVAQLEHRAVPEHGLVGRAAQDEPRAVAGVPARGLHAPASLHPQVAAQRDAALEAEEEVLADGVDGLEALSVETLGDVLHRRARVRRLDREPLADEHLQPPRGARERIALGHGLRPQHGAPRAREEAGLERAAA